MMSQSPGEYHYDKCPLLGSVTNMTFYICSLVGLFNRTVSILDFHISQKCLMKQLMGRGKNGPLAQVNYSETCTFLGDPKGWSLYWWSPGQVYSVLLYFDVLMKDLYVYTAFKH